MAESVLTVAIKAKDEASGVLSGLQSKFKGSFGAMTTAVSALTGAASGLFAYLSVDQFADVGGAVADMAERTGLAADSISALRVAAQETGSSIEAVEAAVKKMQVATAEGEDGTYAIAEAMRQFGITIYEDFPGMTAAEQFEYLAQQIGAIEDPATKTQAAIAAFGKAGTELIPLMEDGAFSMEAWKQKAEELGVAFDDEAAAKADALGDAMDDMKIAMQGVQLQIASALAPVVTDLANKMTPLIGAFAQFVADNPQVVLIIGGLIAGLTLLGTVIGPITAAVGALSTAFMFLAANPIVLVIAAVVALGAAIAFMIANWETVGPKVAEIWNGIVATVTGFVNTIIEALKSFISGLIGLFQEGFEFVKSLFMAYVEAWLAVFNFFSELLLGVSLPQLVSTFVALWNTLVAGAKAIWDAFYTGILAVWELIKAAFNAYMAGLVEVITFFAEPILAAWSAIWDTLKSALSGALDGIKSAVSAVFEWIESKLGAIRDAASAIGSAISGVVSKVTGSSSSKSSKKRALGGPVSAGEGYLVGENGPEFFRPYTAGSIIPNNRLGGMSGGVNVSVQVGKVSSDIDIQRMARAVGEELMKSLKANQLLGT